MRAGSKVCQKWHIDANGVIEGKPAEAGRVNWAGSYCDGVSDE